jgi:hypothetical protein
MDDNNFPFSFTPVDVLQRGRENLVDFNSLFYSITGFNAWDITLPTSWRTPGFNGLCIKNQSSIGSCTGFSTSFFAEMLYMQMTGDIPSDDDKKLASDSKTATDSQGNAFTYQDWYPTSFSPWMAWGNARGWTSCEGNCGGCGAGIAEALTAMQTNGLCRASTWLTPMDNCAACFSPYPNSDPSNGETALVQGAKYKVKNAATIYDPGNHLEELKLAMYLNGGAIAGIYVNDVPYGTGIWNCGPNSPDRGHAIGLVGWSEDNSFINVNSWGTGYPHFGTLTPEFMTCGGFFEADTATPLGTWPRLPGRPSAGGISPLLLAGCLTGLTIGGYALWQTLGNKKRTFEDVSKGFY